MFVTITIVRYPRQYILFALFAMMVFRIPLFFNRKISFFKLLGSGKNGTFDKHPDWQQWGIMAVHRTGNPQDFKEEKNRINNLYGFVIGSWLQFFNCESWTSFLYPLEGHGKWDKKEPFGKLPKQSDYTGPVAILTRATIRLSKLKQFWGNVDAVASQMSGAEGFITSLGLGEMPYIKQATFSVWKDRESMKQFAYQMSSHTEVIKKTRKEEWYSEDMFVRFQPVKTMGTIKGNDPLNGKL